MVNAANARLASGGGVAGAIHRSAGPGLYRECRELAPITTGEAVIAGGHAMPNRYIIHTLGPVAISTGAFGFPAKRTAEIAVNTMVGVVSEPSPLRLVRFVLSDEHSLRLYEDVLSHLEG